MSINMDEIRRILVFILCGISAVTAISGKGYYCRDPDTGKLYPVNSTWPSTTFCGNYTCKLRKKVAPSEVLREFNVTNLNLTRTVEADKESHSDGELSASNISPQIVMPTNIPNDEFDKKLLQDQLNNIQDRLKQKIDLGGGDRFLTDTEIKTISDLLHNVKKSDLEAIVDIYNLAQDIYKEMDKMTSENLVEETMRLAHSIKNDRSGNGHISYWYDPVNRYNKVEVRPDMEHQGSNAVPATAQPKAVPNPNSYFSGPLSRTDFGKLPYYYPMSSFQRQSSYIHPTYNPQFQPPPPPANTKPPCGNKNVPPVAYPPPPPQYYPPQNYPYQSYPPQTYQPQNYLPQNYGGVMKKPFTVETQKLIQPSVLLPYPFSYIQHYNMSAYPFNYFYAENPWGQFDVKNNNNQEPKANIENPEKVIHESDKKEVATKIENDKPKKEEKTDLLKGNLLESLLENAKISNKKPDWQTDPLPNNVLEDVRAHFEEKAKLLKPFSLRKKVKLERVGKVVKLDDLHREKRSIDDVAELDKIEQEEELEAYIEKTTCRSDVDPGFFRMGNLSEPYPACCPQRIDNTR